MTHNELRAHWIKEGAIGLSVGGLYGITSVMVGHPLDTLKTKMQAQQGFESRGMIQTLVKTIRTQGVIGLYRGCIPSLCGSMIFRSTQFAVFEAMYSYFDNDIGRYELPFMGGMQVRVIVSGMIAGSARAIVETPLEYAKIKGQTQQVWHFRRIFTGFNITWARSTCLMTTFFCAVDSGRRHFPDQFSKPFLGPFLTSGIAAIFAWWSVWPLEYMKAQVQSGYGDKNQSVIRRMKSIIVHRGGFRALYRGIVPGTMRGFFANGVSMVVMLWAQRQVSKWGLRD